MAAIAYPHPSRDRRGSRGGDGRRLRLVGPDEIVVRRRRAPSRAVYRRRRLAAVVLFVGAVLLARGALGWLGGGPLTTSEPSPSAAPVGATYVVQPGDTFWTIARHAQPTGDVRPLVARLEARHHGAPLAAGQRIALPD